MTSNHVHCRPGAEKPEPWHKRRTVRVLGATILFLLIARFIPILKPVGDTFIAYLDRMWWALALGLVIGGIVDYFVPREYISHFLARSQKRTILYSVVFGFFMSVCSHGILALAIELHKKGASTASVIAFLLASPWANLPLTLLLIGFFGLKALFFVFGAIVIAIITGFIYQGLEARGWVEVNTRTSHLKDDFSVSDDLRKRMGAYKSGYGRFQQDIKGVGAGILSLSDMVMWWILLGTLIASSVASFVPSEFLKTYMGPTILGLLATLAVATVMEVCSEGRAPLAFELYRQTGAFGNAFAFLMAGVVTDFTEIGLIWINIGRRAAIWLPVITVPQVIVLAYFANHLF